MDILKRSGFVERWGRDKFFRLRTHSFNYAWGKLEEGHKETCPLHIAKLLSDEEVEEIAVAEAEVQKIIAPVADKAKEEAEPKKSDD